MLYTFDVKIFHLYFDIVFFLFIRCLFTNQFLVNCDLSVKNNYFRFKKVYTSSLDSSIAVIHSLKNIHDCTYVLQSRFLLIQIIFAFVGHQIFNLFRNNNNLLIFLLIQNILFLIFDLFFILINNQNSIFYRFLNVSLCDTALPTSVSRFGYRYIIQLMLLFSM